MDFFKNPLFLFAVYGTAVYVLTLLTRKVVEAAHPDWKKQSDANDAKLSYTSTGARWWNEVLLYTIGPVFGVILAFSMKDTSYFPEDFKGTWQLTAMAGLCVGFTCGWFFKIFKKLLTKAAGMKEGELDKTLNAPKVPGGK